MAFWKRNRATLSFSVADCSPERRSDLIIAHGLHRRHDLRFKCHVCPSVLRRKASQTVLPDARMILSKFHKVTRFSYLRALRSRFPFSTLEKPVPHVCSYPFIWQTIHQYTNAHNKTPGTGAVI
jgi:hypothetical protein